MTRAWKIARSVLPFAAAALMAGSAAAYPARVTTDLNLRAGPGTAYRVVDSVPGGSFVDVTRCLNNGWCLIDFNGEEGYVSGSYLSTGPRISAPRVYYTPAPDYYYDDDYYDYPAGVSLFLYNDRPFYWRDNRRVYVVRRRDRDDRRVIVRDRDRDDRRVIIRDRDRDDRQVIGRDRERNRDRDERSVVVRDRDPDRRPSRQEIREARRNDAPGPRIERGGDGPRRAERAPDAPSGIEAAREGGGEVSINGARPGLLLRPR